MDDLGIAGKLFLPIAIVTAAFVMPTPEPAVIEVSVADWPEMPAQVVTVESPSPMFPEGSPVVLNVKPAEPVVTEKLVNVPGPTTTVFQDREVIVERVVEVRTCLDFDELPSWDLARAISMARPGESWSLSGDYYPGLNWLHDTPKPTETEIIAGWLSALEAACDE
jgi:hypothetical protein